MSVDRPPVPATRQARGVRGGPDRPGVPSRHLRGVRLLAALTFAFLILFAPFALLSPLAGALVDRWGHRRVLLVSNVGYLVNLAALVVVLLTGVALLWPLIAILAIDAILKAPQLAALESAVPLLVPRRHLLRANAPRMLLTVTGVVLGPLFVALALTVVAPVGVISSAIRSSILRGSIRIPSPAVSRPRARRRGRPVIIITMPRTTSRRP